MRVRIMRGPPGSGKSFFGSTILAQMFGLEATIASADHFFVKNGVYTFNPKQLPIAHKICRQKFLTALQDAVSDHEEKVMGLKESIGNHPEALIVVDNTNTLPTEIAFYYDLATLFTDDVEILTMEPPSMMKKEDWINQCVKMNRHGVPKRSIISMTDRMKNNKLPYYWNEKMVTREDGFFTLEGKTYKV